MKLKKLAAVMAVLWSTGAIAQVDLGFTSNGLTGWTLSPSTGAQNPTQWNSQGKGANIVSAMTNYTPGGGNTWTITPYSGNYMASLQPTGSTMYATMASSFGLSTADKTAIQSFLNAHSGGGQTTPTNASYMYYPNLNLTAGTKFTVAWNFVATDYTPWNDTSLTSLVPTSGGATPKINGYTQDYSVLGAINPNAGNWSVGSYGSSGWQVATYEILTDGTYTLGFGDFNLGDTALSPILLVSGTQGNTLKNGQAFGPIVSNDPVIQQAVSTPVTPPAPTGPVAINNTNGTTASNPAGTTTLDVTNAGTYVNNGTNGAVTNTGTFTNNGTTSSVTNTSGTFNNNATGTTGDVTNAGTFNNAGTTGTVTNTGTFNNAGVTGTFTNYNIVTNNGTMPSVLSDGQFTNASTGIITGNVQAANTFTNNGSINGTVNNSGVFTNNGTTGNLVYNNNQVINNNIMGDVTTNWGSVTNNTGATLGAVTNGGAVYNSGTIGNVANDGNLINNANGVVGNVTNSGLFYNNNGATAGTVTNSGTLVNYAGGTVGDVVNNSAFQNFGTAGNVTNNTAFDNQTTGSISNLTNNAPATSATNEGTVTGTVTNNGAFFNSGITGDWTNSNTLVNTGAMGNGVNGSNSTFTNSGTTGTVNNQGTFNNSGTTGDITNSSLFNNAGTVGTVANTGTFNQTGGSSTLINNASTGTVNLSGGTADINNNGVVNQSGGAAGNVVNTGSYTITGGTVNGISNSGMFDITSAGTPVALSSYTQTSTGSTILNGNQKIVVSGSAALGGNVTVLGAPTKYGQYTYLTASSVTGKYDTLTLNPDLAPLGYGLVYTGNGVSLKVTPSATYTSNAINSTAGNLANTSNLQAGSLGGTLNYDCNLFGDSGMCISTGVRTTSDSAGSIKGGNFIIGYRASPNWRVGVFVDQGFGSTTVGNVKLTAVPTLGGYVAWNEDARGYGWGIQGSAAMSAGNVDINRVGTAYSESATGKTTTSGQAFQLKTTYAMPITTRDTVTPYAGIRYTTITNDGFTESGAVYPITYGSVTQSTTDALAGISLSHNFGRFTGSVSTGVIQNLSYSAGTLTGTSGIIGLNSINTKLPGSGYTSLSLGTGISYDLAKNQYVGLSVGWQQKSLLNTSILSGALTYTVGF